jgi:hypothetical protein
MAAKLSSELSDELEKASSDQFLDVILELGSDPQPDSDRGSRQEKSAALRDAFERNLLSVGKAVSDVGGEIIRGAWINRTVRARVPAKMINELAQHEKIIAVDVPHALTYDSSR